MAAEIWIRSTVECGPEVNEDFINVPRAQWDAMTAAEQSQYLVDVAVDHQNNVAPCGAQVVDPDEVPDSYLD